MTVSSWLLAAASGLVLAATFPSLELAPLAWIGLAPLLLALRGTRPRRAFALGWVAGLGHFVGTCYWVVYTIGHYTALPLALAVVLLLLMASVLALYPAAFAAGYRWLEGRGLPVVWLAGPLWVVTEWMRGWFFIGFPWAPLATSQYRAHDLAQLAELTGVHGISALLVLVNAVVAAVAASRGREVRRHALPLAVATLLVVGASGWGHWRVVALARRSPAGTARIGVAQGNVEQDRKWDPAYQGETLARYAGLTFEATAAGADLVVWPETATPFFFQDPTALRDAVLELAGEAGVPLLFGSPAYRRDALGRFHDLNRVYLLSPRGEELGTYDKMQLVPFGEYVPYERLLFFVEQIVHATGAIEAGTVATVFAIPGARFGVPICYEDVFPAVTRRFVAGGADFLVNVTNDAWYGRTSAAAQHLAHATFRAIEGRVPLVRAANTGISAVIGWDGRVRWSSGLFETVVHVDEIDWPGVRTVYTRFGDWFVWASLAVTVVAFGVGVRRRG